MKTIFVIYFGARKVPIDFEGTPNIYHESQKQEAIDAWNELPHSADSGFDFDKQNSLFLTISIPPENVQSKD